MPSQPDHKTRAEERVDEIDISPTKLLADIEALQAELVAARQQADEYLAALQRERAEFQNYKRRTEEERERDLGLAAEDLIRKVLSSPTTSTAPSSSDPTASPPTRGSRASPPSTASCARCSRARA